MTDRELLESAAKAAGVNVIPWEGKLIVDTGSIYVIREWDPLIDSGTALELAVTLQLRVDAGFCGCADVYGYMVQATEALGSDPLAATRRAIVRAAAAIGEGM